MLAGVYRIKQGKRIGEVKSQGKLLQSNNLGITILKREDNETSKFAFVISTKISKLAVQRNRINRALNEGVRRNLNKIPKGYDFVLLAKKSIASKTTEEIMNEMDSFFSQFKFQS